MHAFTKYVSSYSNCLINLAIKTCPVYLNFSATKMLLIDVAIRGIIQQNIISNFSIVCLCMG